MSILEQVISHAASEEPLGARDAARAVAIAETIRSHRLAPLAHSIGVAGFDRDHLAASIFFEHIEAVAAEAINAIAAVGVPVLLLKGISLATRVYSDPAHRPMTDIDLLVPASAHSDATRALQRLGYWIAGPAAERGRFHHAATFKRKARAIDLHRSIVQPLRRGARIEGLWHRVERAQGILAAAVIADIVDETLVVTSHIARHELIVPAINYIDAFRLRKQLNASQQRELERRAKRAGLARGLRAVWQMTDVICGESRCPNHLRGVQRDILERKELARFDQLRRKIGLLDGVEEATRLALGTLLEKTGW